MSRTLTEHPFHDPLSHREVVLVIGDGPETTGVRHAGIVWTDRGVLAEGCDGLADVSPELDSAYCSTCHWQARISGAWFLDLLDAKPAAVLRDALNDIDEWGDAPGDSAFAVLDLIRAAGWDVRPA